MSTRQQQAALAAKAAKADSHSSKTDKPGPVDPEILAAIKIAIQPVVDAQTTIQASQNAMTQKLDQAMGELASIREKVDALETSVQASDSRVETVITDALPSITTHISSITTALAMRQLELEVHRRKWALIINGMKGPASEREDDTRAACISLANDTLKVPNAGNTRISACHRLSQESDAGILIGFTDLSERNQWLMNAKNLKGKDISIAPDLPPVLRKLKTDILAQRKELSPPARKQSSVRYLRQWPFVKLAIKDQQDLYPRISQTVIVKDLLGISPNLELPQGI